LEKQLGYFKAKDDVINYTQNEMVQNLNNLTHVMTMLAPELQITTIGIPYQFDDLVNNK
jgi:hypothetical protein